MTPPDANELTERLIEALRQAKQGPSSDLESLVRAVAQAERERGDDIARVLVETKALVRDATADYEPIFTPKVIGWTVAGFFHSSKR